MNEDIRLSDQVYETGFDNHLVGTNSVKSLNRDYSQARLIQVEYREQPGVTRSNRE